MKIFTMSIVLAGSLLLATAATAQGPSREQAENLRRTANRAAARVVSCAIKESPTAAQKVLETEIGSAAEAKRVASLQAYSRKCSGEMPRLTPFIVRNAAAIMLYNEEFRRSAPRPPTTPPAPPASFAVVPAERQGDATQQNIWYVAGIANCVAFADPLLAREAVLSDRDPVAEAKAFEALKPALSKCLRAGAAFPVNPLEFRGILAEQLLHRSRVLKTASRQAR